MSEPILKLNGVLFNLAVTFPWDRGEFISAELTDKNGKTLEKWKWIAPEPLMRQYSFFIPTAKAMLSDFISKIGK